MALLGLAFGREVSGEAGGMSTEDRARGVPSEAIENDPSALPLLEFALDQLYVRRDDRGVLTFAAHRDLHGVEGATASLLQWRWLRENKWQRR